MGEEECRTHIMPGSPSSSSCGLRSVVACVHLCVPVGTTAVADAILHAYTPLCCCCVQPSVACCAFKLSVCRVWGLQRLQKRNLGRLALCAALPFLPLLPHHFPLQPPSFLACSCLSSRMALPLCAAVLPRELPDAASLTLSPPSPLLLAPRPSSHLFFLLSSHVQ